VRSPERGEHEPVMDLVFVAVLVAFFGLTLGYAAFCDRL
jgi:hypothetical protein